MPLRERAIPVQKNFQIPTRQAMSTHPFETSGTRIEEKKEGDLLGKYVKGHIAEATPQGSPGDCEGVVVGKNDKKKTVTVVDPGNHTYDHGVLQDPVFSRPREVHNDEDLQVLEDPDNKKFHIDNMRKQLGKAQ